MSAWQPTVTKMEQVIIAFNADVPLYDPEVGGSKDGKYRAFIKDNDGRTRYLCYVPAGCRGTSIYTIDLFTMKATPKSPNNTEVPSFIVDRVKATEPALLFAEDDD